MITVGMNYKIIPGKDEEFVAVFTKVLQIMKDMAGHGETHLFRDVYSEHDYLIISEWTDEAAFNSFIESDRFKNVVDWGKKEVLAARPKHEIYGAGEATEEKCPAGAH
jgi:heme-degrading monooxygenase HmoA